MLMLPAFRQMPGEPGAGGGALGEAGRESASDD